jgi:hypothetical protein
MDAQMRALIGTILVMGMVLATSAVPAQTYDSRYPVCVQVATVDGTSIGCGYGTLAQCQASASGRGAQCFANPYYAHANKKASRLARRDDFIRGR